MKGSEQWEMGRSYRKLESGGQIGLAGQGTWDWILNQSELMTSLK